jgi:ribose transport system permease protein
VIALLHKTTLGKKIHYLGSNPLAFLYTGSRPQRVIVLTYALSGLLSGCTGVLLVGFTGQSYLEMGNAYQLLSIAAVILGGTSILGGKGGYLGTVAGALLLTLISSVLILLKVSFGGQMAIQGALILALVMLYGREATIDK